MRQLNSSGFMHNRGRLIVADYLTKKLFISWEFGERYFATKLVDYDPAVNNGNWQFVSGSGASAQPLFRQFNTELQAKKYDRDGEFLRRHY
jgi:deoxyribodipyrimidine photo-lyase